MDTEVPHKDRSTNVSVFSYRPLSEEQYGTTFIPKGPSSPETSTVLVRALEKHNNKEQA